MDRSDDKRKLRKPTKEEIKKIYAASKEGDLSSIEQLYTSGVDVTGVLDDWHKVTGLHRAVTYGHYNVVSAFLNWGAEVDAVDKGNNTPLHIATWHDNTKMMSLLLDHGADVNRKCLSGMTPLIHAVSQEKINAVYYLIKKVGVDPTQSPEGLLDLEKMEKLLKMGETFKQQGEGHHSITKVSKGKVDSQPKRTKNKPTKTTAYKLERSASNLNQIEMTRSTTSQPTKSTAKQKTGTLSAFEKVAYSLALQGGKTKALGIKLLLFGPEYVGKTCLVSTLVGDPYQEERSTEGTDVHVCNTSNWKKISSQDALQKLEKKYFTSLKKSADSIRADSQVRPSIKADSQVRTTLDLLAPTFTLQNPTSLFKMDQTKKPTKVSASIPQIDVKEVEKAKATTPYVDNSSIDLTILDFAGQLMYHNTHSVFIRKDNVIMIVFNASRPFSSNVKVRSSTLRSDPMTNSENVHFWMKTVHSICRDPGDKNDKADLLPVILLVATHVDLLGDSAEKAKDDIIKQLSEELEGKPYAHHLAGHREGIENALRKYCIFISNKVRNATVTARLQEVVLQVALPILSKQHPLVYLKIEKQVLSADKGVLKMDEFHRMTNNCGFSAAIESEEFMGVLEYFHHRGTILHFPSIKSLQNLIVVSAHWLTKLLSYLLIAHPYHRIGGRHDRSFFKLTNKGILRGSFLNYMLELFNKSEQHTGFGILAKEAINLMKKFGFVAQINSNTHLLEDEDDFDEEENLLIVPSLFPDDIHNQKPVPNEIDDRNVLAVYYFFPDGFVSPTVYNNMVAECINRNTEKQEDLMWLRKGKAKLVLGNGQYYCVSLSEEKSSIKLSIILLPDNQHSAKERIELLDYFQFKLEAVIADFLQAAKKPVAYIPCCYCDRLHVTLQLLLDGKQQHCSTAEDRPIPKDHYSSLITDQDDLATTRPFGNIKKELSYPELMKWLKLTSDWKMIATFLLPENTAAVDIEVIEDENQGKVRKCQMDLAKQYTENRDAEVSWRRVYQAFIDSDHPNIAKEIKQTYFPDNM